jgi:transposase
MYAAYGLSFKSKKEAYEKAKVMFRRLGLKLESIRLDRTTAARATSKSWETPESTSS